MQYCIIADPACIPANFASILIDTACILIDSACTIAHAACLTADAACLIVGRQLLLGAHKAAEHQLLLALPGHHQVAYWQAPAGPAGSLNRQAGKL